MTAIRIMEKKVTIRELLLSTFQQEILTHCYLLRRTVPSLMLHTFEEGVSSTEMKHSDSVLKHRNNNAKPYFYRVWHLNYKEECA